MHVVEQTDEEGNPEKAEHHINESKMITYDMYMTVMRRKFIPPLMETFQDIIVSSTF